MRDSTIGSIVRITAAAVHQIATELGWHDSHVISQYAALVVVAIALVDENCCGTEGYDLGKAKAEGMAGRTVIGGLSFAYLGECAMMH